MYLEDEAVHCRTPVRRENIDNEERKELVHYGWKQEGKVIPKDAEKFGFLTTKLLRMER